MLIRRGEATTTFSDKEQGSHWFRSKVNEGRIIRAGRRTTQFLAYHPRNVADESEKRERKGDKNELSSPGESI